jgi:hypothetical protein
LLNSAQLPNPVEHIIAAYFQIIDNTFNERPKLGGIFFHANMQLQLANLSLTGVNLWKTLLNIIVDLS